MKANKDEEKEALKLFVWDSENFACVLAHNIKEALELLSKKTGYSIQEMTSKEYDIHFKKDSYRIITEPEAFFVWRGW